MVTMEAAGMAPELVPERVVVALSKVAERAGAMMATVTKTEITCARPILRTLPDMHQSHRHLVVLSSSSSP